MNEAQPERRKEDPRVRQLVEDVGSLKFDVASVSADVGSVKRDLAILSSHVETNTVLTRQTQEGTAGLVEFLNDSREAFRLFNKTMGGVRWFSRKALLPLALGAAAAWAIAHDGRPPEWIKSWIELFR